MPLRIEVTPDAPDSASDWEDVVEVSFRTAVVDLHLAPFDGWLDIAPLPASGNYRIRSSASGMDAAQDVVTVRDRREPVVDRYLLQLWPAAPAPEVLVKQTSRYAAIRHASARKL